MKFRPVPLLLSMSAGLIFASSASAADAPKIDFPAASPSCTLKQRVGLTDVEVTYSRPGVKDRQIFGGIVPYGRVWRTGANGATKISFSTDVKLNGNKIPAGTYALMTVPAKDDWTIIVNKGSEQWGSYKYDEKDDVVRFSVKPAALTKPLETFTIEFNEIRDESSNINLAWEKTQVPIRLEVDYVDKLTSEIEKVMDSDDQKKPYMQAASFYYNHDKDMKKASKWIDAAIAEREAHYMVYLKAEILEKLGDKSGALAAAKRSSELSEKANDAGYVKLNELLIKRLQ
ncbi:MAG: DUF2911 domain-containing protein [Candidatus Obscuribacterales bacterium]|nr:DUF2911 domain-containing protein [Candidatus Obscuribacterales bacterium]